MLKIKATQPIASVMKTVEDVRSLLSIIVMAVFKKIQRKYMYISIDLFFQIF